MISTMQSGTGNTAGPITVVRVAAMAIRRLFTKPAARLAFAATFGFAPVSAQAGTVTGVPNLSFGTVTTLANPPQTQGNISTSSLLLGTQIAISYGQGAGAGSGARRYLRGPGGLQLEYNLYRDSARTSVWGNSRGVNTVTAPFNLFGSTTVYAKVIGTTIPVTGTFTDTVEVSTWSNLGIKLSARTMQIAVTLAEPAPVPEGLKGVPVPTPSNLADFVADRNIAIALGKALFWDMQVGSDGVQACATCHFHAGADNRSKNQVSPGLLRASSPTVANPDTTFQVGVRPNHQLTTADFPFFQRSNPDDPNSSITRNVNDISSSQGVFNTRLVSVSPGQSADNTTLVADPVFNVGGLNTRRVEPRNTPTTVNAVFNFRNFWDGRAQFLFNGVNPFGARDPNARVFKNVGSLQAVQVRIDNASLASQAVGPPSSIFEMSADGRTLMDIGKRLLDARPLALQKVAADDSVLGPYAGATTGLNVTATYADIIRLAFKPEWWNGTQAVQVDAAGNKTIIPMPGALAANQYTQMQANFSLFWGLAIQLYESTLVADDTPFDRYMAGNSTAMTSEQLAGMNVFFGKGKCANCHGGAEFTNASVRKTLRTPLSRMVMGNGGVAVYDEGFYNIAVTPTLEDILNGGRDAFGKPLSLTAIAQQFGTAGFQQMIGISPNLTVAPGERIAVMGAAKTPTVRNVELMNPQMHNGGLLNLRHVTEFYNRGGNFRQANINDVDADITTLGLTLTEKNQLIAFMKSLTDDRVRRDAAPFDHPELKIPNGHTGNNSAVTNDGGKAKDDFVTLPAIGRNGAPGMASPNFLNVVD